MSMASTYATKKRLPVHIRWLRALAVHLLSLVLSITVFSLVISFFAAGVGTIVVWIGLPILVFTLGICHVYAEAKKSLAVWLGEEEWEDLPPAPRAASWWRRMLGQLRTPERWQEFAYALAGSLLDFILAVLGIAFLGGIAEILAPYLIWSDGLVESFVRAGIWSPNSMDPWVRTMVGLGDIGIGVIMLALFFPMVWLCSRGQIGLTKVFLAPSRRAMEARLSGLETAKLSGEHAESQSLSRIERDLHDGPQQRLIRSGIDLATLERRLDAGDIAAARGLLADLRARNDETLAEIRSLSRGFAPPVLSEKGLKEAIVSAAAVAPIPVAVSVELPSKPMADAKERALYFAVSEGLANVIKHSGADSASVSVSYTEATVRLAIADDGRGGAVLTPGHGLAGLQERLVSVGGAMALQSDPNFGTRLLVEVSRI